MLEKPLGSGTFSIEVGTMHVKMRRKDTTEISTDHSQYRVFFAIPVNNAFILTSKRRQSSDTHGRQIDSLAYAFLWLPLEFATHIEIQGQYFVF